MAVAQSKSIGHTTTYSLNGTVIGQIVRITPMSESFEDVEVTDLDDPIVQFIPSAPILLGEVSIEFLWTPNGDNDVAIDTALRARSQTASHVITYTGLVAATNKIHTFTGYIKSATPGVVEGKVPLTRTIVIRPNSTVTLS